MADESLRNFEEKKQKWVLFLEVLDRVLQGELKDYLPKRRSDNDPRVRALKKQINEIEKFKNQYVSLENNEWMEMVNASVENLLNSMIAPDSPLSFFNSQRNEEISIAAKAVGLISKEEQKRQKAAAAAALAEKNFNIEKKHMNTLLDAIIKIHESRGKSLEIVGMGKILRFKPDVDKMDERGLASLRTQIVNILNDKRNIELIGNPVIIKAANEAAVLITAIPPKPLLPSGSVQGNKKSNQSSQVSAPKILTQQEEKEETEKMSLLKGYVAKLLKDTNEYIGTYAGHYGTKIGTKIATKRELMFSPLADTWGKLEHAKDRKEYLEGLFKKVADGGISYQDAKKQFEDNLQEFKKLEKGDREVGVHFFKGEVGKMLHEAEKNLKGLNALDDLPTKHGVKRKG